MFRDTISGIILRGQQLAQKLGYPTANINCNERLTEGVYGGFTTINSRNLNNWPSLLYFKDGILEVHLVDLDLCLYGSSITVTIDQFIRPPLPYTTAEAMKTQIAIDLHQLQA